DLLQRERWAEGEIGLGSDTRRTHGPLDLPILAHCNRDRVAQVNELKESLQLVIAVGAPTGDVQEEIELGGRRPVRQRSFRVPILVRRRRYIHRCQLSTSSRTRTASRCMVMRAGSASPPVRP